MEKEDQTMEKKKYIIPQLTMVALNARNNMLQSSVEFSESEYSGGSHRSRESSWDDEEE